MAESNQQWQQGQGPPPQQQQQGQVPPPQQQQGQAPPQQGNANLNHKRGYNIIAFKLAK